MKGDIVSFLELFAYSKKVNLTTGHHDANQRPVVCTEALQGED